MSIVSIRKLQASDKETLFSILSNNEWPFHSGSKLTRERYDQRFENNFYTKLEVATFLILLDAKAIGYVRIFDLGKELQSDETPLFDIRLASTNRNQGAGSKTVKQVVDYIFNNYPNKNRIEATTRGDNKAMKSVLKKCLFAKEAHYRNAWNGQDNKKYDAIGYGILREDWEQGTITSIDWES